MTSDVYPVRPELAGPNTLTEAQYRQMYEASLADPDAFWGRQAERLQWFRQPTVIKGSNFDAKDFHIRWFADGELNASVNS